MQIMTVVVLELFTIIVVMHYCFVSIMYEKPWAMTIMRMYEANKNAPKNKTIKEQLEDIRKQR